MGSNILNMYHQAPYRNIGHKVLRSTSESGTSESSCNQNSPEYTQSQKTNEDDDSDDGEYWNEHDKQQVWSQNEQVNITKSNHDISYEENEQVDVQNVSIEETEPSSPEQEHSISEESIDGNSLVEGDDYDVIQVIAVDPDLDLASSDEEPDECEVYSDDDEYLNPEDDFRIEESHENQKVDETPPLLCPNDLGINLDVPVVSNVDEYFIKNDQNILEAKDDPVVKDVDEYFIKEPIAVAPIISTAITNTYNSTENGSQYEQGIDFRITESIPNVATENAVLKNTPEKKEETAADCINDLESLSNIEYLKHFILDDLQNQKFKNAPRTQNSVSLPQTPMHTLCMDIDAKTCFSFEDLDLSDLSFEQFKDKSTGSNKNDDIPRTLTDEEINSFLITGKNNENKGINENIDDLTHQDMEIEKPLDSIIKCIEPPENVIKIPERRTSTPLPKSVLEFCIEKSAPIKDEVKSEVTDFVDIETCNEGNIPVLKANNLCSLLEQFEASEKFNTETVLAADDKQVKVNSSSRMRLQDAGIQLNKNKMRHILMPSVNATITRSPSPVHADHDYCSTKKRHSTSHLKGGQSLLKPDVLSRNNQILSSRHRSCKDKKIVYNLSSDDESDLKVRKKLSRTSIENDLKSKKPSIKITKSSLKSKSVRKKVDESVLNDCSIEKSNGSVIVESACKASDIYSQNSSGSIKLIIKNKSEVIINNVDVKDSINDTIIDKQSYSSISVDKVHKKSNNVVEKGQKLDSVENKDFSNVVSVKTEVNDIDTNPENFYAALFTDKKDVQIPQTIPVAIKEEIKIKAEEISNEQPAKKKKLNLQEYKLRRGGNSNANSAQVSPEAIFPETPNLQLEKSSINSSQNTLDISLIKKENPETPKTIFDPIREASRKIIMISKKQKVEAMRKKEEEMLMRKIGKVETLDLQPLISDSEMLKIIGMTPEVIPVPMATEKIPAPQDYDEVVLVSVDTNTDENMFKITTKSPERIKRKSSSPPNDKKSNINFKIRKNDHLLKHNVFDSRRKESSVERHDRHHNSESKIDKDRYKDIAATLKSVEKQVDTKISSNSLFASIQDVVLKKAPSSSPNKESASKHSPKRDASIEKQSPKIKTTIVREYDVNSEHGEDKVILHLKKDTVKPKNKSEFCQTEPIPDTKVSTPTQTNEIVVSPRNRHDSDMSLSSEDIPVVSKKEVTPQKPEVKIAVVRPRIEPVREVQQKDKSRPSDGRYENKYRRSRSHSRGKRRNGSPSRKRSRSRDRYRPYRRRESPYRRKRRSRSPYRSRRSPSHRRDYKTNRTRSRSRHNDRKKSRTPIPKRQSSPKYNNNYRTNNDKKPAVTQPQPVRKPTVSESSYSSSVSRSSSVSKSSTSSSSSSKSSGSYRKDETYRSKGYVSYSSEDRENNTPVEERRIVFVGKLEKDITKVALRTQFSKFGPVTEVRLHSKEDGSRYGFVTYQRPRDAWSAVESAKLFPQYDVGFGGRRAFCRQSYADLDGLEAKYTESVFHGQASLPIRRNDDMSFEQMLLDMKNKLNKRKGDKTRNDDSTA